MLHNVVISARSWTVSSRRSPECPHSSNSQPGNGRHEIATGLLRAAAADEPRRKSLQVGQVRCSLCSIVLLTAGCERSSGVIVPVVDHRHITGTRKCNRSSGAKSLAGSAALHQRRARGSAPCSLSRPSSRGHRPPPPRPQRSHQEVRRAVVDSLAAYVARFYAVAEDGRRIADQIRRRQREGAYDELTHRVHLAEALSADFKERVSIAISPSAPRFQVPHCIRCGRRCFPQMDPTAPPSGSPDLTARGYSTSIHIIQLQSRLYIFNPFPQIMHISDRGAGEG